MIEAHDSGSSEAQLGPRPKAYVESAVHSQGADLDAIGALAAKLSPELALDLGAGGRHVSYVVARHARRVIATDLSSEMLAAVAETAREKGLSNIETAEALQPSGSLLKTGCSTLSPADSPRIIGATSTLGFGRRAAR